MIKAGNPPFPRPPASGGSAELPGRPVAKIPLAKTVIDHEKCFPTSRARSASPAIAVLKPATILLSLAGDERIRDLRLLLQEKLLRLP